MVVCNADSRVYRAGRRMSRPQNLAVACAYSHFSFLCRCRPMLFLGYGPIAKIRNRPLPDEILRSAELPIETIVYEVMLIREGGRIW